EMVFANDGNDRSLHCLRLLGRRRRTDIVAQGTFPRTQPLRRRWGLRCDRVDGRLLRRWMRRFRWWWLWRSLTSSHNRSNSSLRRSFWLAAKSRTRVTDIEIIEVRSCIAELETAH